MRRGRVKTWGSGRAMTCGHKEGWPVGSWFIIMPEVLEAGAGMAVEAEMTLPHLLGSPVKGGVHSGLASSDERRAANSDLL